MQGMNCELEMVTPGPTSETISNLCDSDPCLNGGTCTSSPDGFVCSCTPGFTGLWCENQNTCLPSPCVRGICTVTLIEITFILCKQKSLSLLLETTRRLSM